jgi:hypothetical protein
MSLSTAEAESIETTTYFTQVLWMKNTLTDIQVEYDEPIPIHCDNTSTINILKKPMIQYVITIKKLYVIQVSGLRKRLNQCKSVINWRIGPHLADRATSSRIMKFMVLEGSCIVGALDQRPWIILG